MNTTFEQTLHTTVAVLIKELVRACDFELKEEERKVAEHNAVLSAQKIIDTGRIADTYMARITAVVRG